MGKSERHMVRVEDIKIPQEFALLAPSKEKISDKAKYFNKHKQFENPVVVIPEINKKGFPTRLVLVDGYINYFISLCRGLKYIEVTYQNEYIM